MGGVSAQGPAMIHGKPANTFRLLLPLCVGKRSSEILKQPLFPCWRGSSNGKTACLALLSSGKDSAWALHTVRQRGEVEVIGLLTTVTEPYQRVPCMGSARSCSPPRPKRSSPLVRSHSRPCPNAVYERVMSQAIEEAKRQGVTQMIFGDLFLEEVPVP